jgi:hypothetical protein
MLLIRRTDAAIQGPHERARQFTDGPRKSLAPGRQRRGHFLSAAYAKIGLCIITERPRKFPLSIFFEDIFSLLPRRTAEHVWPQPGRIGPFLFNLGGLQAASLSIC